MVNIHTLYLLIIYILVKGVLDTIDKLQWLQWLFELLSARFVFKMLSLLDIRRKFSINKNLDCTLVCIGI